MPKALPRGEKEGASRQVSRDDRTGKHRIEAGTPGAIPQHLRTIRAAPKTGQYRTASQKRTQTIPCKQLTNAASFCRTVFPREFPRNKRDSVLDTRLHHSVRPDRHPDHRKPRIKQCQRQQQNRNHGLASRTGRQTARCHQHAASHNACAASTKVLITLHRITLCRTAPRPLGTSVPTEQTTAPCESSCSAPADYAIPHRRPHTADCALAPE